MKRKIFSILFALVLVLTLSLVTAVPVAAADLHVGSGQTYTTIQAAINAAQPSDTIIVHDGTYPEDLTVDTAGLTLKSVNGSGATTIQGSGTGWVITLDDGATNFTLGGTNGAGFKVIGGTNSTVLLGTVGGPSGVEVSYNTLDTTGNPSMAIAVGSGGAASLTVSHNTFDLFGSATGVYFDCDPITDLLIDSNIVPGTGNPKWLNFVEDAGVNGAMISNNTVTKGNIVFRMATRTNALNNITIKGNTFAESYIAIGPQGTGSNLVTNLTIIENSFAASNYYDTTTGYAAFEILGTVPASCVDYGTVTVARNNFNNFTSSHWAVINGAQGTMLNAEWNWWGSNTGPTHSGNSNGTGGKIREGETYSGSFHPDGDVDYVPWLTGAWTGMHVGLITNVPDIVAISVNPTSIDFGTVYPGQTATGPNIVVANIGTHEVDVNAWIPAATVLQYLQLHDGSSWLGRNWTDIVTDLAMGNSVSVPTKLPVPASYTPSGPEVATLVFIARASP